MSRAGRYFSWDKQEKFCSECKNVLGLKAFRVVNKERQSDMSSHYCSLCKECENIRAKAWQKAKFKKGYAGQIAKLELKIESFQKRLQLLKEKQNETNFTKHTKTLLREVDPLMVIDGLDVVDDHETDMEAGTF